MESLSTDASATATLSYVRVELPAFDPTDVDTWICMCDNMMADAGLKVQTTMFRKCLAKLPPPYFRHVKHLATASPLPADCYDRLKDCLLRRLQLTPAAKWRRFKEVPPCSETRPPSQVYADLETLYPKAVSADDTGNEMLREKFLECLPVSLQLLCREWLTSYSLDDVALRADAHFGGGDRITVAMVEDTDEGETVTASAVRRFANRQGQANRSAPNVSSSRRRRDELSAGAYVDRWCYIHRRYGPAARKCVEPCTFISDTASGNANGNRQ